MNQKIKIGNKVVGKNFPTFIVAEIGFNHNGKLSLAKKMVTAAAKAGADAVKFQNFIAEKLVSTKAKAYGVKDKNQLQIDLYKQFELSQKDYRELAAHTKKEGVIFFSTPFDEESADFLDSLHVPAFKIASCDLTHLPLIQHVAKKKKPIILSTGMADFLEIQEAVQVIKKTGNQNLVLLHCVSSYPCEPKNVNLSRMAKLDKKFHLPVGFSDHTLENYATFAAIAQGATVIEKHFTLSKDLPGVDHYLSMTPSQLEDLVKGARAIEAVMASKDKEQQKSEKVARVLARRSLTASQRIVKGSRITKDMLSIKRPGTGIKPKYLNTVIGKIARKTVSPETVLTWNDV